MKTIQYLLIICILFPQPSMAETIRRCSEIGISVHGKYSALIYPAETTSDNDSLDIANTTPKIEFEVEPLPEKWNRNSNRYGELSFEESNSNPVLRAEKKYEVFFEFHLEKIVNKRKQIITTQLGSFSTEWFEKRILIKDLLFFNLNPIANTDVGRLEMTLLDANSKKQICSYSLQITKGE